MFGPRAFIPSFSRGLPGLSLTKVIGGISKTLGVVNEIIPLYKEAKPLVSNARNAINIIKELGNTTTNRVMSKKEENLKPIKEKIASINNSISNQKGPTFFQ